MTPLYNPNLAPSITKRAQELIKEGGVRVRHSTFKDCYGVAIAETVKETITGYEKYPACFVQWDKPGTLLDTIMTNYNLVFIVPAIGRKY